MGDYFHEPCWPHMLHDPRATNQEVTWTYMLGGYFSLDESSAQLPTVTVITRTGAKCQEGTCVGLAVPLTSSLYLATNFLSETSLGHLPHHWASVDIGSQWLDSYKGNEGALHVRYTQCSRKDAQRLSCKPGGSQTNHRPYVAADYYACMTASLSILIVNLQIIQMRSELLHSCAISQNDALFYDKFCLRVLLRVGLHSSPDVVHYWARIF
ncbi:hypothetical protein PISMIDRAFT_174343 [Pisolithus microcarpus 441]|uniref:Uncharacterized protein n=1 Tax=Pisolithus microcarpus 441 TaxID=765257 RepID=A0A0C9YYE2_9AGAM|nr:hypothetical protein PISMIDRAFT_174343 [Pisolithus microcarpus 441]